MVGCSSDRETGDRRRMASGGLPPILAVAIPAMWRSAEDERGASDSHTHHGGRKFRLGCTENSGRASEARFRSLRAHSGEVSTTTSRRSKQTMAGLPCQPSRGNRRHGFLYRTHSRLAGTSPGANCVSRRDALQRATERHPAGRHSRSVAGCGGPNAAIRGSSC
jgi:hypothetical protein